MSKETKEYRKRLQHYLSSMEVVADLLENCFISKEDYIEIERRLAEKYQVAENSLFNVLNKNEIK